MFDIDELIGGIARTTVLCIGDLMLDEFVYGEVSRISPEAPTPVIAAKRSEISVGGAGNVARNIAALGAHCIFVGLVGEDDAGRTLRTELGKEPLIEALLVTDPSRPTTRKVRFVSEHFSTHMLRADWEEARAASDDIEAELIAAILPQIARADVVLLSDYAKGVLTAQVVRTAIDAARGRGKRVVVDPKVMDFSFYKGASVLTPNQREFTAASRHAFESDTEIGPVAQALIAQIDCEAILVTQSEHGMTLAACHAPPVHIAAHPVKVRDVSGAGDSVVATLSVALAAGAGWEAGLRMANAAAAVVVAKSGTAVATRDELRRAMASHANLVSEEKIVFSDAELALRLMAWRADGHRIGFTNGCFDILHPGHVKVLTAARAACDRLIVGLNSDASVKRLKGASRPLQSEQARAEVLAALEAVDLVVVFGEDTPIRLIERVRPRVLIKGGDYTREQVVGHDIVEAAGGEVLLVDILKGFSTTSLVTLARESANVD